MTIPKEIEEQHIKVCEKCEYRKLIARAVDMHFDWLDCPYDCWNDYEHWIRGEQE